MEGSDETSESSETSVSVQLPETESHENAISKKIHKREPIESENTEMERSRVKQAETESIDSDNAKNLSETESTEIENSKIQQIRESQANADTRYRQLLTLMKKSDLFVKMIFERMDETKKENEAKIERLKKKESGRKRTGRTSSVVRARKQRRAALQNNVNFSESSGKNYVSDSWLNDSEIESEIEKETCLFTGGTLRDYQIEGQRWLNNLYENGVSGILADEMGLGKTVQVIAAIARMVESGVSGPFFIVAPLSTLPNWAREFSRFTPLIPVILYHATKQERIGLRNQLTMRHGIMKGVYAFPVLITSYEIALNDATFLRHYNFKIMVVDEGHRLKNHNCLLLKALTKIQTDYRLLLTGTPLQNNLAELWSLLNFILPEIFNDLNTFEEWFNHNSFKEENSRQQIIAQENEKQILGMMHQILTPFMLRRLKSDVDLTVPPKREIVLHAPLTPYQKTLYDQVADDTIRLHSAGIRTSNGVEEENKKDNLENGDHLTERKRRSCSQKVDYCSFFDEDPEDETMFLNLLQKSNLMEIPTSQLPVKDDSRTVPQYETHIKLNNIVMLFRRIVNHGHMVEYPLDEYGDYLQDERLIENSGKMKVLDKLLKALKATGHKVLIFSQFTSMLDILQDYCNSVGYQYSRLDGKMKLEDRKRQLEWFSEEDDIFIFLLSTRAGGLGLNITAADTVIFFDHDWNPQCDIQAQDRCHRIGQTRPVLVFRLVVPHTIEEKILEYANGKRTLERLVIRDGRFKKSLQSHQQWEELKRNSIDGTELLKILTSKSYLQSDKTNVIDDEDLERILDRSDLWKEWEIELSERSSDKNARKKIKPKSSQ